MNGTSIFAGAYEGGIYRSTDNGENWVEVNTGLTKKIVKSFAIIGSTIFAGTSSGGVFRSTDNGANWTDVNEGLQNSSNYIFVNTLIAAGTSLFVGVNGGVFRSTDNGDTWTKVITAWKNKNVTTFAMSGSTIYAGTDDGVYRSIDNGASWTVYKTGLKYESITSLMVVGSTIFAGTYHGVFRSTDNGDNWTEANTGTLKSYVHAFAVNGTTLFAGTGGASVWKLDISAIGVEEERNTEATKGPAMDPFPNPSTSSVTILLPFNTTSTLEVFNIYGAKVFETSEIASAKCTLDVSGLPNGMYSVIMTSSDHSIARTAIVVGR